MEVLGTTVFLVSGSAVLVEAVWYLSPLLSHGINAIEPVPLGSLGLVAVPVTEEPNVLWVSCCNFVGTEVIDSARNLFFLISC